MEKGKLTCIIIEDEPAYQQILNFFLDKLGGLEVLGAFTDTDAASTEIEEKKPDIIFLDISISGLEGPEFIKQLAYKPKVVIVSGHSEEFINTHYDIEYQSYIQKPVDLDKLGVALSRI